MYIFLLKWMIFFHLPPWWLSDPFNKELHCLLILQMVIRLFQPLTHQEDNLKVMLLIKSGYYIIVYKPSVMRVGSDTFGDPIFQMGLEN